MLKTNYFFINSKYNNKNMSIVYIKSFSIMTKAREHPKAKVFWDPI